MPRHRARTTWTARPINERFQEKYVVLANGCWQWTGTILSKSLKGDSYGVFKLADGTPTPAHRISYIIHKGPIPQGKFILHSCDYRQCVNPDHLRVGTHQDNMEDLRLRGRAARGEKNVNAKLTAEDIKLIRQTSLNRPAIDTMAKQMKVTPMTICFILCRYTWAHVP